MTEDIASNPFADMGSDIPHETVRDYAAALVRNGMSVEEANRHLGARGTAPLVSDSLELAEFKRDQLMRRPGFGDALFNGDPAAAAEMLALNLRIAKGGLKLTDRDPAASDYSFPIGHRLPGASEGDAEKYHDDLASLSADLKLAPETAKSLVDSHLNAVARTDGMSQDERETFAREERRALESSLGPDTDARLKAASDLLSRTSGRMIDLARVLETNGANVAITLLFQAEHLAARS